MKKLNSLMFVAAMAILPVACGTSTPTGVDVAALEADATSSALRNIPPAPPQATPDPGTIEAPAPSPNSDPTDPAPAPSPDPSSEQVPNAGTPDGTEQPPAPSPDPSNEQVPNPATPNGTEPAPPAAPNGTEPSAPGSRPATPAPGSRPAPSPPSDPGVPTSSCLAVSIEIVTLSTITDGAGVSLEAILMDKGGMAITDGSCEKLVWTAIGDHTASRAVITYGADSRFVTITGPAGSYKVSANTADDLGDSMLIVLQ